MVLAGLAVVHCPSVVLAEEWRFTPQLNLSQIYSDNITLAPDSAKAKDDFVTQISPKISLAGEGRRVKLDSSYTLQSLYYANNYSGMKTYHQLQLGGNAELIEDLFYLSARSRVSQQSLSAGQGIGASNLNLNSGRGNLTTSNIEPSLRHRLGKFAKFDLTHGEGWVSYGGGSVSNSRLQNTKFSLSRWHPLKLDWQLDYGRSRQWTKDVLKSDREYSAATIRYALFKHASLVVNGGRENGYIVNSTQSYKAGSYWSAGLRWQPSQRITFDVASGNNDQQASLMWAPNRRTSLNASYIDRAVGVHARSSRIVKFRRSTRRVEWGFNHVKEIGSYTRTLVGLNSKLDFNADGELVYDQYGVPQLIQEQVFGVIVEQYQRDSTQGSFTYKARRNEIGLSIHSEQRHYETTGRRTQLHGGNVTWKLKLSARSRSELIYNINKMNMNQTSSSTVRETDYSSLSLRLEHSIGRRTTAGTYLRTTEVNRGLATNSHSENRISAYAKVIF